MTTPRSASRPKPVPVDPDGISDALKAIPRWVVWRYVEDVDPGTGEVDFNKPPVNARTGGPASSTNPKTWTTFAEALAAYQRGGLDGIGIVLTRIKGEDDKEEAGGLVGVDLDDCRDPKTGEIQPWAQEIIRELDTYAGVRLRNRFNADDPKAVENHLPRRLNAPLARRLQCGHDPKAVENAAAAHPSQILRLSFNAATTRRPWRTSTVSRRWCCPTSFNAATTRRPWRTAGSIRNQGVTVSLQCGHDPKAVENLRILFSFGR